MTTSINSGGSRAAALLLAVSLVAACTTTQTQISESEHRGTRLEEDEAVVILSGDPHGEDEQADDCVGKPLRGLAPTLRLLPASEFRDALYPYFTQSTMPHTAEEFEVILENPVVQQRIASLRVHYLIVFSESYESRNDWHNYILCGAGYGGGGCLGFAWWDRQSGIGAEIWDLTGKSFGGKISSEAKGTGIMPAFGLPVPLYMPATESAACKETARQLLQAIGVAGRSN